MGKLGEAVVEIRPDLKPLDAGLGQAEARIGKFVGRAKGLIAGLAVYETGRRTAGFLSESAKAAAALGETMSKVKFVFEKDAGLVIKRVEQMAGAYGAVKGASLDAAANIGLVGQAAGLSNNAAAKLSVQMLNLASDSESFFDVGMDVALEKIRSALVGESEPIRSFGVLLNEAAVAQEALRLGLTKTTAGITEQAKVMARASLISKGMSKVKGDKDRTLDSEANQMKKVAGDWENMKADFGKGLLKPLGEAIKLAKELDATIGKATGSNPGSAGEGVGSFFNGLVGGLRLVNKAGDDAASRAKAKGQGAVSQTLSYVAQAGKAAFLPDQDAADRMAGVHTGGAAGAGPTEREKRDAKERARLASVKDRQEKALRMERMRIAGNPDFLREKFKGDKAFALGGLAGGALRTLGRSLDAGASFSAAGKQARDREYAEDEAERKRQSSLSRAASITGLLEAKGLAQTSALEKDPAVEQQKKTNDKLDDVKALLGTFLSRVGAAAGAGAILKGRS